MTDIDTILARWRAYTDKGWADDSKGRLPHGEIRAVLTHIDAQDAFFLAKIEELAKVAGEQRGRAEKAEAERLTETALASTEMAARLRAEGKLADAVTMRERAERERDEARGRAASAEQIADLAREAIRDCVAALGTSAFIPEDASDEFHAKAPDEIRAWVARLTSERDEAE